MERVPASECRWRGTRGDHGNEEAKIGPRCRSGFERIEMGSSAASGVHNTASQHLLPPSLNPTHRPSRRALNYQVVAPAISGPAPYPYSSWPCARVV